MTWLLHNSFKQEYREPFGALIVRQDVTIRLVWLMDEPQPKGEIGMVQLILADDEGWEKPHLMQLLGEYPSDGVLGRRKVYETTLHMPKDPQLLWYVFRVAKDGMTYSYGRREASLSGPGEVCNETDNLRPYQITVYKPKRRIPDWYKKGIVYQIFVDRFRRTESKGSEAWCEQVTRPNRVLHLDWHDDPFYVRDEKSGAVRYWDFFGGNLDGIIEKLPYLKTLGVRCLYLNPIFESLSNHKYDTGDYLKIDPMFGTQETFERLVHEAGRQDIRIILDGVFSHTGEDSRYFNRYGNYDSFGACQSQDSPYYDWYRFRNYPHDYECWWDVTALPNVNEMHPGYLDFIIRDKGSVLDHWMEAGVAGWRLDVADELPDRFIRLFKKSMLKKNQDSVLIGEVWEDATNKVSYGERREYLLGAELDATMHYPFRDTVLDFLKGEISASRAASQLNTIKEHYPPDVFQALLNILGTHDTRRLLTELEGDTERLTSAFLWQMCSPGVPHIYYGDEAGLTGEKDPMNRKPYPWGRENGHILHQYRQLAAVRSLYPVLQKGEFSCHAIDEKIICLKREQREQDSIENRALVFINGHDEEWTIHADIRDWPMGPLQEVFPDHRTHLPQNGMLTVTLKPGSGILLLQNPWVREEMERRQAGILMPISALPSAFGVGNLGGSAERFLDFLEEAGHQVWQILPYSQGDTFHSPYCSISSFAGNLLYIDPEDLVQRGLLDQEALTIASESEFPEEEVDYDKAWILKKELLRLAFLRYRKDSSRFAEMERDIKAFREKEGYWLEDHALFKALKRAGHESVWNQWEPELVRRDEATLNYYSNQLMEQIDEEVFYQYLFFSQWDIMKEKAVKRGIRIIGDMPLYVAFDSADVWCHQELYKLDDEGSPAVVAGVPPDYFSETGQLWGNPIYDWAEHERTDYDWWVQRIATLQRRVDTIRIDHFRGLADYYEVPACEETAEHGTWQKGPGIRFFEELERQVDGLDLLSENLGYLSYEANQLKEQSGYPGMLVLQHCNDAMDENRPFPPLYLRGEVLYTGTHDDETLMAWLQNRGMPHNLTLKEFAVHTLTRLYYSDAELLVIPLQDLLLLGNEARFNRPGVAGGNWLWRATNEQLSEKLSSRIRVWAAESGRLPRPR